MRLIKKGKKYAQLKDAEKDLNALHEEFPTTTIPLGNKLNIMVYSKNYGDEKPTRKHLLEIKSDADGAFYIEIAEKAEKKTAPIKATSATTSTTPTSEPMGKFTSMVQLARAKKKKKL